MTLIDVSKTTITLLTFNLYKTNQCFKPLAKLSGTPQETTYFDELPCQFIPLNTSCLKVMLDVRLNPENKYL